MEFQVSGFKFQVVSAGRAAPRAPSPAFALDDSGERGSFAGLGGK
jgi:hypothetical protein